MTCMRHRFFFEKKIEETQHGTYEIKFLVHNTWEQIGDSMGTVGHACIHGNLRVPPLLGGSSQLVSG